ncbi:MAG: transglutaminase domain-containing protein, partial [Candidatus Brocadiae bacterium]|nr:transglutaminase domain-containing protein [Candidatus Brocadiia bacterium]
NLAAAGPRGDAFGRALGALRESTPSAELCGAAVWLLSRLDRMKFRREGDKGSIPDSETFDPRTFYENVFYAVRARNAFPWGRDASDHEFLMFVLPPRLTDEPLQRWRRHFFEVLEPEVRGLTDREEAIQVARQACADFFQYEGNTTWEDFGMLTALAVHEGRCEDCSNVDNALLRSIGIPGSQAFTPWWGHGDGNHAWTWVPGAKGFAGDGNSGVKIYVKTLDRLEDVTEMHTPVTRLEVETGGADGADAQLMVWNHGEWRRVMGVKVEAGRAVFDKVGCRRPFALLVRVAGVPDQLLATEKGGGWRVLASGPLPAGEGPVDLAFEKVSPLGEFEPDEEYAVTVWDGTAWSPVAARRLQTGAVGFRAWADRAYRVTGGKFAGRPFTVNADPAAESPVTVR